MIQPESKLIPETFRQILQITIAHFTLVSATEFYVTQHKFDISIDDLSHSLNSAQWAHIYLLIQTNQECVQSEMRERTE